jgi:hypothetical protein
MRRLYPDKNSPEYRAWRNAIRRCCDPAHPDFAYYGRRGITVHPSWHVFSRFFHDLGFRPSPRHSLHRVDNHLGYLRGNVVWSDRKTQSRHRRGRHLVTFERKTQCLAAWAEEIGIPADALGWRLRRGWTTRKALTTPVRKYSQRSTSGGRKSSPDFPASALPGRIPPR